MLSLIPPRRTGECLQPVRIELFSSPPDFSMGSVRFVD